MQRAKINIKLSTCLLVFIVSTTGCTKDVPLEEIKIPEQTQNPKEEKRVPYIYNGDFKVRYAPKRVVWFSPYVTSEGDVVSERTITVLPAYPVWTNDKEKNKISNEILKFIEKEEE
ncbi:MAG: hypothetical protein PHE67_04165 [Campylobacterales bacterium]|nr:hypothetical protein [Campylobacterales bacterium]